MIDKVIKDFDFEHVRDALILMPNPAFGRRTPTLGLLKAFARHVLEKAHKEERTIASAHFEADYNGFTLTLSYVVAQSHAFKEEIR